MTDKAETAIAYVATRFDRCGNLPIAHTRGSLGDEECANTIRNRVGGNAPIYVNVTRYP